MIPALALIVGCATVVETKRDAAYQPASNGQTIEEAVNGPQWRPTKNKKIRAVLWGIVHNHARGKFDAMRKLKDDYEIVGWVNDSSSKVMRMAEPKVNSYTNYPCLTPQQVFDEVKPDLTVCNIYGIKMRILSFNSVAVVDYNIVTVTACTPACFCNCTRRARYNQ